MKTNLNNEDQAALHQIAAGGRSGERALEQLYRKYRPKIFNRMRRKQLSKAEAEDIVQDVFLVVSMKAQSFRGESAVSSWIHGIANNKMVDFFRSSGKEINLDEEAWDVISDIVPAEFICPIAPDPKVALQACFDKAYEAFEQAYPSAADLIFRTLENEDWSTNDIAQFLGRTPGAAREYFSQCKKKLKSFMAPCQHLLGAL